MTLAREISETGYYHVVNRGVNKQAIYLDEQDYKEFLNRIAARLKNVTIPAWCLMNNHFHLLVHGELDEMCNLIGSVCISYVKYFNSKYSRTGHLFEERFWSEPINDESYALCCMRYIHKNPEKAGVASAADYRWSSYHSFLVPSPTEERVLFLEMIGGIDTFAKFHAEQVEESFIDIDDFPSQIKDYEAVKILKDKYKMSPSEIGKLTDMKRRKELLAVMKNLGCKSAQIQRLTGLSRSAIWRATSS